MSNILRNAKTPSIKKKEIDKKWKLIDAKGIVLGRLAVIVADFLRGKNKVTFTPHMDDGDYVVLVNARHIVLTGKKSSDKVYYHHTGYPGGIKSNSFKDIISGNNPERIILHAVKGMLPRGPLGRNQLKNLRVYLDDNHCHIAQNPEFVDVSALSKKNKFRGKN